MIKRLLSLLTAFAIIASAMVANVSAAEANQNGWIELLEYSSVHSNGENWFTVNGTTGSVTIPIMGEKRLRKIDMLLWNPSGQRFTSASVTMGSTTLNLDVLAIGGNLTRVVGYLPNTWYESVTVNFTKSTSSSQTYEVLSCKVTPVGVQEFEADADVFIDPSTYDTDTVISVDGNGLEESAYSQIRINVYDWMKYDTISIWGSCQTMAVSSIRASISTLGLPFEMTYMQSLSTGETVSYNYNFSYSEYSSVSGGYGSGYGDMNSAIEYGGKVLFCITIDLAGVDRTLTTDPLYVYMTGVYYGLYGYSFNCQYVNGEVATADTSALSWWQRFTNFMRELFPTNSSEGEQFEEEAGQQSGEMEDLNNELQNVTRPALEDVDTNIEDYVSNQDFQTVKGEIEELMNHQLIVTPVLISLTIALVAYILYGKR